MDSAATQGPAQSVPASALEQLADAGEALYQAGPLASDEQWRQLGRALVQARATLRGAEQRDQAPSAVRTWRDVFVLQMRPFPGSPQTWHDFGRALVQSALDLSTARLTGAVVTWQQAVALAELLGLDVRPD